MNPFIKILTTGFKSYQINPKSEALLISILAAKEALLIASKDFDARLALLLEFIFWFVYLKILKLSKGESELSELLTE